MSDPDVKAPADLPEALRGQRQLGPDDTFQFGCHSKLACFTRCCADVNIFLTPVDVLNLARKLSITTGEFLERHAIIPITKELQLPVVVLRMGEEPEKRCPFVNDDNGCGVYEARPWSCRMYPVGMAMPPARAGVEPQPIHYLFQDDFCDGGQEAETWTVASWRENQGLGAHEELEEGFQQIVAHPWFIGGRQLNVKGIEMFHTACYDIDKFRRFVFDSTFTQRFELEDEYLEELRTNDEAMLRFAFRWLRFALFGEPTMKVRDDAAKAGRNS